MKKTFLLTGILLLFGAYTIWAAQIEVASSIDKRQVQVDEEVSFTIRILGASGNVPAPRLPAFQGFDSFYTGRTSQFTFVNGKSSTTVEFNYILIPKVAGRFTLTPVEVWIEGKRFETQPLEVEVMGSQGVQVPSAFPSRQQPSAPPTQGGFQGGFGGQQPSPAPVAQAQPPGTGPTFINDDNVFIKAAVDKQFVYPNEQILLTYSLHTRYDTRYEGFEEEPSVSGFWIEDFPLERDLGRETVSVEGKRYVKADVRKIALFPTSAADYTIQPGVVKVSIREQPQGNSPFDDFFDDSFFSGANFFSRRVERLLKPNPITIKVKPFPEKGKPASFNGAVGQFHISAAVDKNEVKQNEPVTLKLTLEGQGNIETLAKPPVPELTSFKIYEGDSSTELFKTGGSIGGKKHFEIIFIPTESGELSIPPLEFSYFDPRNETYQTLRTQPFPLHVIPSKEPLRLPAELAEKEDLKKEINLETKGIHYIHEDRMNRRLDSIFSLFYRALMGFNLLGISIVGYGLVRRRREEIWERNPALRRRTVARTLASQRVKNLRKLAKSQKKEEAEAFVGEAEKLLTEYLCNKFNVSSYQFTRQWLREKLSNSWDADDPLLNRIDEFYETASAARYGRGVLPVEQRSRFLELIEEVIRRVEKIR